MAQLKTILIMAGGTGGHVFPALAVANFLQKQGVTVHWLGTAAGLEARLVPQAGFSLHTIAVKGLRGKGMKRLLAAPFQMVRATLQARAILKTVKPDVVIGFGGFASGPGGLASWLARVPLIIHEQNAIAGLTNKLLAPLAKYVCEGFAGAFKPAPKVIATGNPVRPDILNAQWIGRKHLLVLGGSLGAAALNKLVPEALALWPENSRPEVLHQTGEKHLTSARAAYAAAGVQATIVPFIENMAEAYANAALVLCRAGASTIAELCAVGVGAVLVPYPHAVDDHQTANANWLASAGAAVVLQESGLTSAALLVILRDLIESDTACRNMATAAFKLRKEGVAEQIFNLCEESCR